MPPVRPAQNPDVAVERRDAPPWLVGSLAGGLAAFLLLSFVALRLIYPSAVTGPSDAPRGQTAQPRLQLNPAAELAAHRAAEWRELTTYGWVDRQAGRVRLPIDRAMQDLAASGIKDWPENAK